jgi:uncharacterized protein
MDYNLVYLFLIVLLSHTIETITGFGGTIIAVALGAHFYSLELLLPVLVPLAFLTAFYITLRYYQNINVTLLLSSIIPFMGLGLIIGIATFNLVQTAVLQTAFGIFVILFTAYELYKEFKGAPRSLLPSWAGILCLIAGGFIHGLYATGGPLVVYYASRKVDDKKVFRSTLCSLWTLFSGILLTNYFLTGRLTPATVKITLFLLPALALGLVLGEWLHFRVAEKPFKKMVHILLLGAGLLLVLNN